MAQLLERFDSAVQILIGEGAVKHRLASAYSEFLEDLQELEVPVNAKGALRELHAALHRVAPVGKGSRVTASVQKMSAGEAAWYAETILRIYAELLSQPRRAAEPLKVVETSHRAPPRFLVRG